MLTYQYSLKAVQYPTMVAFKFAGVICLVYFTMVVNAGKKPNFCKSVLQKLDTLESLIQGTFRNVFYLANVSNGLNMSL